MRFAGCPKTSSRCFSGILNHAVYLSTGDSSPGPHAGRLAGQTYDTAQRPSIGMHANAGITFDLLQIRLAMPGLDIVRFHSLCGISETVTAYTDGINEKDGQPLAVDFRVLVDGQERFNQTLSAVPPETTVMDVKLEREDRYLTLITKAPDAITLCWAMLGEPALELKPYRP